MESQFHHNSSERRPTFRSKTLPVKWFKEWVPQDVIATGGKCSLMKWVTADTSEALDEKSKKTMAPEPEPEPTTEVLFLCSYDSCGKIFIDAGALRKHADIHAERHDVCLYEGCGKIYEPVCVPKYATLPAEKQIRTPKPPYGKASSDRPYACIYDGCNKTYIHEYKLKLHYRTVHPGRVFDVARNEIDEASDQDAFAGKRVNVMSQKNMPKPNWNFPPAKVVQSKGSTPSPAWR